MGFGLQVVSWRVVLCGMVSWRVAVAPWSLVDCRWPRGVLWFPGGPMASVTSCEERSGPCAFKLDDILRYGAQGFEKP